MDKIRLMVDAASDLSWDRAKSLGIELLTAIVSYGGKEIPEREIDHSEYIDYLLSCDEVPTTSAVSPSQLVTAFETAMQNGIKHVICVTISSTGSAYYSNCFIAKDMFEERHGTDKLDFYFIDSMSYTFCYGDIVAKAATFAMEGAGINYVLKFLKEKLSKVYGVAGLYTLKYAKKSGRISGAAAFVGEMMGLKPILLVDGGKVNIVDKARGESNIIPRLIEAARKKIVSPEEQDIKIFIGSVDEKAVEELKKAIKKEFSPCSIAVDILGPSLTTNVGPKVCGFTFYGEPRKEILDQFEKYGI